jgi:hypothetical protein
MLGVDLGPAPQQQTTQPDASYRHASPNRVSHKRLTEQAHETLIKRLTSYGNVISQDHSNALFQLCGIFTNAAQGHKTGRQAFPLACGMAKSSAVRAWIATLVALKLNHVSVAVANARIEDLCQLKRDLIADGVPPGKIALLYAKGGKYSEPSNTEKEGLDRQIMLVSHALVRTGEKGLERFYRYGKRLRDVMIYDEALQASDAFGIGVVDLKSAIGWLRPRIEHRAEAAPLLTYLTKTEKRLAAAMQAVNLNGHKAHEMALDAIASDDLTAWRAMLPWGSKGSEALGPVDVLFDLMPHNLSVVGAKGGGVIRYDVVVSKKIENLIILDASWPISELCQAGQGITNASDSLLAAGVIKKPLSALKTYEDVTVYQLRIGGGRSSVEGEYAKKREDNRIVNSIVDKAKEIPSNEAALFVVFQDRQHNAKDRTDLSKNDFVIKTTAALKAAGIDPEATVEVVKGGKVEILPRFRWLNWGRERSTNEAGYCSHIFCVGVTRRSHIDLAGHYIGEKDDPQAAVTNGLINRLVNSECSAALYQALARGSMRFIDDNRARKMTAYVVHTDTTEEHTIEKALTEELPGLQWTEWESDHVEKPSKPRMAHGTAEKIVEYLCGLPQDVTTKSIRAFKVEAGLTEIADRTFTRSLDKALESVPWRKDGRSIARVLASDYGFTTADD